MLDNTYFTIQLSTVEKYPSTLYDLTSRIKADRLSISVKCQIGMLYTFHTFLGQSKIAKSEQNAIVVSLETPVWNWVDKDVLFYDEYNTNLSQN